MLPHIHHGISPQASWYPPSYWISDGNHVLTPPYWKSSTVLRDASPWQSWYPTTATMVYPYSTEYPPRQSWCLPKAILISTHRHHGNPHCTEYDGNHDVTPVYWISAALLHPPPPNRSAQTYHGLLILLLRKRLAIEICKAKNDNLDRRGALGVSNPKTRNKIGTNPTTRMTLLSTTVLKKSTQWFPFVRFKTRKPAYFYYNTPNPS